MDQTKEAWLFGSGRRAIGPPSAGRKRWYAVGGESGEKMDSMDSSDGGVSFSVATTP